MKWFVCANEYYSSFAGIFPHVNPFNWRVITSTVSGVIFLTCLLVLILNLTDYSVPLKLIGLGFSEFLFIGFYANLLAFRDKLIIKARSKESKCDFKSMEKAKISKLKSILRCNQEEFFDKAKDLDALLSLYAHHSAPFSFSVRSFVEWIYSKDARPRIITMLVFLASAIVVLSVRDNASLQTVFDAYREVSWTDIGVVYILFVCFAAMTLFALSLSFRLLVQWLFFVEHYLNGSKRQHIPAVEFMIRDLLSLHGKEEVNESQRDVVMNKTRN